MTLNKFNRAEWLRLAFVSLMLSMIAGCQVLGLTAPQNFSERVAAGYTTCATIRDTALILGRGGKLTLGDAENIQRQTDHLRTAIDLARAMYPLSEQNAEQKLSATLAALVALDTYLKEKSRE